MSEWHCKYSCKNKTTGHYECGNQGQDPFAKIDKQRRSAVRRKAELAELRADREMLDWIGNNCWKLSINGEHDDKDEEIAILFPLRELLTKAMKEPT